MNPFAILTTLVLMGCPRSSPVPEIVNWSDAPRLPSPTSGSYTREDAAPTDPAVRLVMAGRSWDASLSGAAAGLALEAVNGDGGLTRWEIREALWRAGYPYPVDNARGWSTARETPPPQAVAAWVAAQSPTADVGLVRARASDGDAWVGMAANPRLDVGVQPRKVAVGSSVAVPAIPGAKIDVVDGVGKVEQRNLHQAQRYTLVTPGE